MPALGVGSWVRARAPLGVSNGSRVVPAVVTRVWAEMTVGGLRAWVVNLHAVHDGPETVWRSSVYVFEDEAAASSVPGWNAWLIPQEEGQQ